MANRNKLSNNDLSLLQCPFDSNALSSRLSRVADLLNDISATDLLTMDDQSTAKEIHKLRNLLEKARQTADGITEKYYQGQYESQKRFWQ